MLEQRASAGASSSQIADTVVAACTLLDANLKSIIGARAVAMLLRRSLLLAAVTHPWMPDAADELSEAMGLDALRRVLGEQASLEAAAGGGALLQSFEALLASLIGSPLTERLLRSAWANLLDGLAVKDPLP